MIYITFKGTEYEIPYDPDTLQLSWAIDSTFDNGYFETEPMEAGSGLDFSRRIPRDLKVRYEDRGKTFIFRTSECYVEKYSYSLGTYVHKINLISDTKDLTVKTLENITLTQPKGDFGQYSHSVNILNETLTYDSVIERDVWNIVDNTPISFINTINSNTSYYDDMEVLTLDTFTVSLEGYFWYKTPLTSDDVTVYVKYGGTTVYSETFQPTVPALFRDPVLTIKTFTFKHTPTALGTYTVEMFAQGASTNYLESLAFSITAQTTVDRPVRTYAQLIDKMLRNTEYVLSPNTRSRLNLTAPEGKYEGYTIFDGLQKIASELRALVKVDGTTDGKYWKFRTATTPYIDQGGSLYDYSPYDYAIGTVLKLGDKYYEVALTGDTVKTVDFKFYDTPNVFDPIGELQRSEQAELEDYVSALELNTENVIKPLRYSPHKGGWKSLRALTGIGQMTADNIGYELEDNIERIVSVKVRGLESQNASGTETWSLTDETDINDRVLEQAQWDTLLSEADYTYSGKLVDRKNNHLYYIQGDNKIYGMSYYGETESRSIGQANVVRALYETVLAVRSLEIGELVTRTGTQSQDDIDSSLDLNIELQITYSNLTQSRARVYKDDQSGFERERIKYMNESANVNETDSIGSYAQQLVNRLGGTKVSISGVADDWSEVANVGDIDSSGRVYTLVTVRPNVKIEYEYLMVQDYNVISSYIGVNSRHRVEEISSGSTTHRTLRYTSKLIFTDTSRDFSTRLVDYTKLLEALNGTSGNGLNYGYLECYLANGEVKKIHLSIDSDSKGKTIEVKWKLRNNYSAGIKRYIYNNGSTDIVMNSEVQYTDYYGKVNDILFGVYFDSLNTYDKSIYPEADSDNGDGLFTMITDVIDKDAGEILHGLVEIPILSESSKVRVYDGFAKWNRVVEGTERIRVGLLSYVPIKNATRVNLSLIRDVTPTITIGYNTLNIEYTTTGSHKGIVFYNQDTLELLLAYVDGLNGSQELSIPYYIVDSRVGGGISYTQVIGAEATVTGEIQHVLATSMILDGTIKIDLLEPVEGQDEYGYNELKTEYKGFLLQNSINFLLSSDIQATLSKELGEDNYESSDIVIKYWGGISQESSTVMILESMVTAKIEFELAEDYYGSKNINTQISGNLIQSNLEMILEGNISTTLFNEIKPEYMTNNVLFGNIKGELIQTRANMVLEGFINSDIQKDTSAQIYAWAPTSKTTTTPVLFCVDETTLGNVRSYLATSCSFKAVGNGYFSTTNDSTPKPTCSEGATYTVCTFQPTIRHYLCTDYVGDGTTTTIKFEECKLVNL